MAASNLLSVRGEVCPIDSVQLRGAASIPRTPLLCYTATFELCFGLTADVAINILMLHHSGNKR